MKPELITVVETNSFIADAKACMNDEERAEAINMIAAHPECGDLIPGGGGIARFVLRSVAKGRAVGCGSSTFFTMNGFRSSSLRSLRRMTGRI